MQFVRLRSLLLLTNATDVEVADTREQRVMRGSGEPGMVFVTESEADRHWRVLLGLERYVQTEAKGFVVAGRQAAS